MHDSTTKGFIRRVNKLSEKGLINKIKGNITKVLSFKSYPNAPSMCLLFSCDVHDKFLLGASACQPTRQQTRYRKSPYAPSGEGMLCFDSLLCSVKMAKLIFPFSLVSLSIMKMN